MIETVVLLTPEIVLVAMAVFIFVGGTFFETKVVWSWIVPRWDENNIPEILEGTRYTAEYADFVRRFKRDEK